MRRCIKINQTHVIYGHGWFLGHATGLAGSCSCRPWEHYGRLLAGAKRFWGFPDSPEVPFFILLSVPSMCFPGSCIANLASHSSHLRFKIHRVPLLRQWFGHFLLKFLPPGPGMAGAPLLSALPWNVGWQETPDISPLYYQIINRKLSLHLSTINWKGLGHLGPSSEPMILIGGWVVTSWPLCKTSRFLDPKNLHPSFLRVGTSISHESLLPLRFPVLRARPLIFILNKHLRLSWTHFDLKKLWHISQWFHRLGLFKIQFWTCMLRSVWHCADSCSFDPRHIPTLASKFLLPFDLLQFLACPTNMMQSYESKGDLV